MALPSNDHHVHSDGYYSEKGGQPDAERLTEEILDEIENRVHPAHIEDLRIEFGTEVCCTIVDERAGPKMQEIADEYGGQYELGGAVDEGLSEARIVVELA